MTRNGNGPAGPEGTTMTDACDTIVSRSRLIERGGTTRAALMGGVALAALAVCGARAPVRAGNTAVVINSTPSGSTYTNSGVIHGTINGVVINAPVSTVTNTSTGTITGGGGSGNAIGINATVNTLTNSGTLSSPIAISNWFGYIGVFNNSGKILGNNTGFQNITGVTTLTNTGTISGASTWGVWNNYYSSGFQTINNSGSITGAAVGLINTSSIGNLVNTGLIQNPGYYTSTGIWGVTAAVWNYGNTDGAGRFGTLTNSGTITGPQYGVANNGEAYTPYTCTPRGCVPEQTTIYTASIGLISNESSGTIYGGKYGVFNGVYGTIGTITNSGKILGNQAGIYSQVSLGNVTNNAGGTISGGQGAYGIYNGGVMGTLDNYGTIGGQQYGVYNNATAGPLNNYAGATITGGNGTFGVYNRGTMGSVTNGGLIISGYTGFYNAGKISGLSNTGTITSLNNASGRITGGSSGVGNSRQLTTLTNTGVISGTVYGVNNIGANASISSLNNLAGGTITGSNTGVSNTGSIGTLSNNGVISGAVNAINSFYVLTNIQNAGTINGNISIFPVTSAPYQSYITITGATSNGLGTLTGGTIGTGIGNLTMVQNNLLMDDVYLPATSATGVGRLVNYGQLSLVTNQTINGNFKNSGTLVLGTGVTLTVTGEWTDPPASSTGAVYLQASSGEASAVGTHVVGQTAVPVDASWATIDGIGYGVSNIRTVPGPSGTYLLVADVARTDFIFRQEGDLALSSLEGTRAVIQHGPGATYLIGPNTYTGPTTVTGGVLGIVGSSVSPRYVVTGGTLRIDGLANGTVNVAGGGTLAGSGAFRGGTIGAGGVIAPSNISAVTALSAARDAVAATEAVTTRNPYAPGVAVSLSNAAGNLVSNGTLTLAAGSTYRVGVNGQGLSDHLLVNGAATLGGGAVEVRALPGTYGRRTEYTILTASNGVTGSFGSVTSDLAFLTPTLTYDPTQVMLTLRRNDVPYRAIAATSNQYAVATGLEGSFGPSLSPVAGQVIDALTFASGSQARAILTQISGEGIAGAQTAAYAAVSQFADAVRGQGIDWVMGTLGTPVTPDEHGPKWRAWAAAMGGSGHIDGVASTGSATVNTSGGGGAAGLEVRLNRNFIVGFAAGGVMSSYSVSERATSGKQTGAMGAVYGVTRFDRLYAMGLVGFGGFGTDSTRWVGGPAGMENATGNLSSNAWTGRVEVGYRFETPMVNIAPYVALQGTSLQNSGLTETVTTSTGQPGGMGLRVQGRGGSSVPGAVGVQFDRRFAIDDDWAVRPVLRVAWVHDFSTDRAVTAGLAAVPASLWTVQGASAASDAADINLSVQALHRNGLALTASAAAYAAPRVAGVQGQLRVSYQW